MRRMQVALYSYGFDAQDAGRARCVWLGAYSSDHNGWRGLRLGRQSERPVRPGVPLNVTLRWVMAWLVGVASALATRLGLAGRQGLAWLGDKAWLGRATRLGLAGRQADAHKPFAR